MFVQVQEPAYSRKVLDEFEQRYGIESTEFYGLYRSGMEPINDRGVAELWAFHYEILVRVQESVEPRPGHASAQDADQDARSVVA